MNRFKFQAFFEEFPFLGRTTDGHARHCDSITVKRITHLLLCHVPTYSGATGAKVSIADEEIVSFVFKTGEDLLVVENAVRPDGDVVHNEAHQDNEYWDGETVLEGLDRATDAHNVSVETLAFIVIVESGYNIRDHYSQPDWRATIYKPAKWTDLASMIADAKNDARRYVRAFTR